MIQKVVFAASTDDSRPNLTGVHMTTDGDYLVLAATDGYRISIASAILSPKPAQKLDALIPARALSELSRIAVDGDETLEMNFPVGRGQVVFHLKDAELISQLIEGNFPNYTAIIPPSFKTHTVLTTADLLKACRQTEIIAREGNFIARLDIQPEGSTEKPPQLEISAISEQTGSSEVIVDASVDGTPLLISFNVRFLREVLEVIRTPNVLLETNAANTPAMIRPVGDDTFKHIIMPMNIQRSWQTHVGWICGFSLISQIIFACENRTNRVIALVDLIIAHRLITWDILGSLKHRACPTLQLLAAGSRAQA